MSARGAGTKQLWRGSEAWNRKFEGKLTHGVRPGHTDILVLEHEEIAIPRPGLFLAHFNREKVGIVFIYCIPVGIYYAALQM